MTTCAPCTPATPNCNQMLAQLMSAYTALVSGQAVAEVEINGNDRTAYHRGNIAELKTVLISLHSTCGNATSAALLGLPVGASARRAPAGVRYC